MDDDAFNKLVEQARTDPQFFHDLVFNTESALASLDYLDQSFKDALDPINPEDIITLLGSGLVCRAGGRTVCLDGNITVVGGACKMGGPTICWDNNTSFYTRYGKCVGES